MRNWTMRRAEALLLAVTLAFSAEVGSAAPNELRMREVDGIWQLPVDTNKGIWIGLDGLLHKSGRSVSKPKARHFSLVCASDSIDLSSAPADDGIEPAVSRRPTPCDLADFSQPAAPSTLYDLMLFGDAAALPWIKIKAAGATGYTAIPSLALRLADSSILPRFPKPTVVRQPFLKPLLGEAVTPDSAHVTASFRIGRGAPKRDTSRNLALREWNWSVVHDQTDKFRYRIDSRNTSDLHTAWVVNGSASATTIRFDDTYRREPRRVEVLRFPRSTRQYLVMEITTLFGDGIWTDLWIVGPDTVVSARIGDRGDKSGGQTISRWRTDAETGSVMITTNKKTRRIFQAN